MATLIQMRQFVSKRLQDPNNTAVSSDDVDGLINQALSYWKNTRFNFNEATDTTTLFESDPEIPLPDDWLCPALDQGNFVIEYSGIRYPLGKVSEPMYNMQYLSNGRGQPQIYAKIASDNYQVYPIPDRDYTLRRFWLRDYTDLSGDSDTNDFSDNAATLLEYTACAYGSRDFRQDTAMYQAFWQQALDEEENLLVTTRKDNATGRLTQSSFLTAGF